MLFDCGCGEIGEEEKNDTRNFYKLALISQNASWYTELEGKNVANFDIIYVMVRRAMRSEN